MKKNNKLKQKGFFLSTQMLISLSILTIMISVGIISLSMSSTKGAYLLSEISEVKNATSRFKKDTGCYPTNINALVSIDNFNNVKCTDGFNPNNVKYTWKGPYLKGKNITHTMNSNGESKIIFPSYVKYDINNNKNNEGYWVIVVNNVESEQINSIMERCNGKINNDEYKKGYCFIVNNYNGGEISSTSTSRIKDETSKHAIGIIVEETKI